MVEFKIQLIDGGITKAAEHIVFYTLNRRSLSFTLDF